ncbi:hypothetical protein BD31_I1537 [Candidatus Nitrosopumilus salaria BD31]|uniref:Pre-16S rRNA-processing nuclease YqgF n=1 Tax=Candidatus Nitrosopumilus salarius BD31 TaxID=859350 RepID=I3D1M7_9ARCH|nr:hypothetical protein [Candidatus Nitrosopumilus salaria]EIJ65620.1 hypothetical protein BD31_I1537 [Candidatus Nitrosopumilus salaria BD31]
MPEEILDYSGNIVFTTTKESPKKCEKVLLHEDIFEHHHTVIRGMMIQKLNQNFQDENLILGIDPGQRIGLSIFYYGQEIERSFYSSVEKLISHIIQILGGLRAKRKILKIGDGNMKISKQIVTMLNLKFCSSFELEFVDERKTSLKIKNFNQRGKRDMLSAKYISQRDGCRYMILPLSMTG